jgi:hypothetical protein
VGWNKAEWRTGGPGDLNSGLPSAVQIYTDMELCIMEYSLEGADVLRSQLDSVRVTSLYSNDYQGNPYPYDFHWAFTLYYEDPGETIEGVPVMSDDFITEERWKRIDFDPLANPGYGKPDIWGEVKEIFGVDQEKPDARQIGLLLGAITGTILQAGGLMKEHLRFPDPDTDLLLQPDGSEQSYPSSERKVQGIPIPMRSAIKKDGDGEIVFPVPGAWWTGHLIEHYDLKKPEQRVLRRLETRVWATDAVSDAWALVSGADRIFVKGWS